MDILNGDGFYGHNIFYRLLPIDLHEFSHQYHSQVLNALAPFTIFTMYRCMKCVVCITTLFYVLNIIHALSEMTKYRCPIQSLILHDFNLIIQFKYGSFYNRFGDINYRYH